LILDSLVALPGLEPGLFALKGIRTHPHSLSNGGKLISYPDVRLELRRTEHCSPRTIHLVLDNLSTHTRKAATEWFGERDGGWLWSRFTVHNAPKHGSWLNQAEIEIGLFSRQCLGKRRIASLDELTTEATAWNQRTNHAKTTIEWKFTRHKARLKLKYKMMRS